MKNSLLIIALLFSSVAFATRVDCTINKSDVPAGDTITVTLALNYTNMTVYWDKRNKGEGLVALDKSIAWFSHTDSQNRAIYKLIPQGEGTTSYLLSTSPILSGYNTDVFMVSTRPNGLEDEYIADPANIRSSEYFSLCGLKIENPNNYAGVLVKRSIYFNGHVLSSRQAIQQ